MPGRDKREVERIKVEPGQMWRARFPSSRPLACEVKVVRVVQKYRNRATVEHAEVEAFPLNGLHMRITHIRLDRLRKDYELL
jgi:hypothetical protein